MPIWPTDAHPPARSCSSARPLMLMMLIRPGRRCSSASRLMALSMFRMRVLVMPIVFLPLRLMYLRCPCCCSSALMLLRRSDDAHPPLW